MSNILTNAGDLFDKITGYRRSIHANPELSFEEFKTSAFIQEKLKELNINFKVVAKTGVVATIGKGDRCIAFRADIDALPVKEETGLEFSSKNDGIMHACGHDMHTSMLLGAAELIKKHEDELNGCVKLIFQPGEEKLPGGASVMIKEGALEDPRPEAIFGQHIFPEEPTGTFSFASGPVMASTDELYWTIRAKGCHAAQPHLSGDPILAASQLVVNIQSIMTKYRDPLYPAVISVTSFNGGNTTNIIPGEVKLQGTMRTFDEGLRKQIHGLLQTYSSSICSMYNVDGEFEIVNGYPSLHNNELTTLLAKNSALDLFDKENVKDFIPKMWAEDFAYYAQEIPATFWFLGVKPEGVDDMPALHNAKLIPDEKAMKYGMSLFAKIALEYFNK